ncbi:MAG: SH3 domain-containing protein [Rhizobiaceae bacterium]|nr:SH3 domain-containing protein [Rhizobiaceae bacterium]MCV0408384.1 SH3 domain-containing protein [Rhizobiaceae bacterium]
MRSTHTISAAALAAALVVPAAAMADSAFTTADVNMRAGPHVEFPRIATLPAGAAITVHGCTDRWTWCDADWRGLRGWVSARYLEADYGGRRAYLPDYRDVIGLPTVTFEFTTYWDRWYRDRPWYRERNRWYSAWREDDWDVDVEVRSRSFDPVDRRGTASIGSPAPDVPPGIAKKRGNFCPPGQAKKGRC